MCVSDGETEKLALSIDHHIELISEKHRMHRKIQFLLDIRGLLVINKIKGRYVEFGVYRGEMMYAATRIIGKWIEKFVGLDTFTGLPAPQGRDEELFVFEEQGFMASPKQTTAALLADYPHALIQGDFREAAVAEEFEKEVGDISVLSVDCNWPSSVETALNLAAPHLQCGSILYMDDFFVATRRPNFNVPLLDETARRHGLRFVEFKTYPPCARAFLVEKPA